MIFSDFDGLTTGQVAGIIAVGIFIVQLLSSFIWPLLLVAFLRETETAVTWSVVARVLQNSYWPTVLRTDAAASNGVRRTVTTVSWAILLTSLLVSVAAIVTPLGLFDDIAPEQGMTDVNFRYVKDTTTLGQSTAPRPDLGFSRICFNGNYACPNTENNITIFPNGSVVAQDGYDTRIPKRLFDFMSSGLQRLGPTVSSTFDIQYRNWVKNNNSGDDFGAPEYYDNGSPYDVGEYRALASVLRDDDWEAVEGLIVDTKQGGVGFRNHSVPSTHLPYGGTWSEDLLFIEPVTECVNLNMTLDYTFGLSFTDVSDVVVVDHGGFVNINRTLPSYDNSNDQNDPQLSNRVYQGAWYNLVLLMLLWNVTNPGHNNTTFPFDYLSSHLGLTFPLPATSPGNKSDDFRSYNSIAVTDFYSLLLPVLPTINSTLDTNVTGDVNIPLNPWHIYSDNFTDATSRCTGTFIESLSDKPNPNVVPGSCGLLLGIPTRKDNSSSFSFERGSKWTTPMYTCGSVNRATIKSVEFGYNNSQGLEGLTIRSIVPKTYSEPSKYPLWAFENITDVPPGYLVNPQFFWGLVAKEDKSFANMTYKRSPELWLGGYNSGFAALEQNLAAVDVPAALRYEVYHLGLFTSIDELPDYSGANEQPVYDLWKKLSATSEGSSRILNLIWTDMATNALVGTRGWIPSHSPPNLLTKRASTGSKIPTEVPVSIRLYHRIVRYHVKYAIPAIVVLAIIAFSVAGIFALLLFGRATPGRVNMFLTRLSTGRIMTEFLDRDATTRSTEDLAGTMSTKKWLKTSGRRHVDISTGIPREAGYAEVKQEEAKTAAKEEQQRLQDD